MKQKYIDFYSDVADRVAAMSHATRLKVGAVIVKDDSIVSYGYNGTPAGWDNTCEIKEWMDPAAGGWLDPESIEEQWPFVATSDEDGGYIGRYRLKTKPEVLHAERNALDKLTKKGGNGAEGAAIFVTHSPCIECAKSIFVAGIKEVFYREVYRSPDGLDFLKKCNVKVQQVKQ